MDSETHVTYRQPFLESLGGVDPSQPHRVLALTLTDGLSVTSSPTPVHLYWLPFQ